MRGVKVNRRRLITAGVLALIASAWVAFMYHPATESELEETDTQVVTETRYLLMSGDSTILFAFRDSRGDTLLSGIVDKEARLTIDTIDAQYIKRWQLLPYGNGHYVAEPYDTLKLTKMSSRQLHALLKREAEYLEWSKKVMAEQRVDVDYYLRTHLVTERGFDVVQRYGRLLTIATDSVLCADSLVKRALRANRLRVVLDRRYRLADSTGARLYVRVGKEQAMARLKKREAMRPKPLISWVDSIGHYEGERDSLALPHGYGCLYSEEGDFYVGEWVHGKRTGTGFRMVPEHRLRIGEWREDKFIGERIVHMPERIYGIDISRYQHEKGRKRFQIQWDKLRITSLGTFSKKKIKGVVDYPVSFVYIKATEGTTVENKYFRADYQASRKHGYRTGAYHFFSLKTLGSQQARHFMKIARYQQGDLPPVIDIEPTDRQIAQAGGIEMVFRNVRGWISEVERHWGVKPILYISQRFVNKYLPLAPDLKRDYDVWIARYGEYKPDVNLVYWQLCQDGRVQGIHGPVDLNIFNGFEF